MNVNTLRVIKLGGSLLEFEELVPRLRGWLERQSPATSVLIVGGGPIAEAIRRLDRLHGLDDDISHELCITAMHISAELVGWLLPEAEVVHTVENIQAARGRGTPALLVLTVWDFMSKSIGQKLPRTWDVTSDSIAAAGATALDAEELVLLKSALPERADRTLAALAAEGYVDDHFPHAAAKCRRVRCVNLRSDDFAEIVIEPTKN